MHGILKGMALDLQFIGRMMGGLTGNKLSGGFPQNEWIGRIGIDLCLEQPNVLYALVDNQEGI